MTPTETAPDAHTAPATATATATLRALPHAKLATEVRGSVIRLARRLRQQKADESLTDGLLAALGHVHNAQPLTIGELAAHEGVAPPSMTRAVDKLVEQGLLRRTTDPGDRRRVLVETTDAGRDAVLETRRRRDAWLAPRLAALTPEERRTLADATRILRELTRS